MFVRWSTRGVRPRSALAKAAVLRTVSFSFAHASLRFMRRGMGRGSRRWSTRSVRPHSALAKAAVLRTVSFSFVPTLLRLRRRQCGHAPPVEHAERAPPFGTRKNALRRWRCSIFFLMPALVQARRGVGMFAQWSTRSVRPRSALAKAAVLRTVSFSFVHASLRLRRRQCAQMKNSPWRGCFCSLVPVVGLEPTRILLHRILSPARLPVSPHRRR